MQLRQILVGIDFSPESEVALARALWIAMQHDAQVTLLHVTELPPRATDPLRAIERAMESLATEELDALGALGATRRVPTRAQVAFSVPHQALLVTAREVDAQLIVVGARGKTGVKTVLLGSVSDRVIRGSDRPVLVVRAGRGPTAGFDRILVPTDFGDAAAGALSAAIGLASRSSKIRLVHFAARPGAVAQRSEGFIDGRASDHRSELRRKGDELVAARATVGLDLEFTLVEEPPASGIEHLANAESFDLIALGSHGHHGLARAILGSVAEHTVRRAPCSVLVVHDQP